eukprot:TRINITY_DN9393_c0_g1_i3.p1 TRINITY_DN9393_c0_g1~~TRINITY_DN9393_c0_g1_i3.p1  ORF type:complete len:273 (-),score=26.81 TRINITY_DN9393_c0_g1_i3:135-863(-)
METSMHTRTFHEMECVHVLVRDSKRSHASECARIIARDVPRTFSGDARIDAVRLHVAELLRGYARADPEIGYVQGMCFVAAIFCLLSDTSLSQIEYNLFMADMRSLWLPGFPIVMVGTPMLERLLGERDPDLTEHFDTLDFNLDMVVPGAWLSGLAKWLPVTCLLEILPFLRSQGMAGLITATLLILMFHRASLLQCLDLEGTLTFMSSLPSLAAPDRLAEMCNVSVLGVRHRIHREADAIA